MYFFHLSKHNYHLCFIILVMAFLQTISPTSQEKLCQAITGIYLCDGNEMPSKYFSIVLLYFVTFFFFFSFFT